MRRSVLSQERRSLQRCRIGGRVYHRLQKRGDRAIFLASGGKVRPTFLLLGAMKCGTSSLSYSLRQHPDIFMSEPREPRFFEAEYENGLDFYWRRYFSGWAGQPVVGESRQRNLYLPYVPARIREALPEAKLLVIVRNPVDRAYSHWWFLYSQGRLREPFEETVRKDLRDRDAGLTFEGPEGIRLYVSGLDAEGLHRARSTVVDSGYYAEQLARYRKLFSDSRIKVLFLEDLVANPESTIAEAYAFLGAKPVEPLSPVPARNPAPERAIPLLWWLRKLFPPAWLPRRAKEAGRSLLRPFGSERPPMARETRRFLVEHYSPHNRALEQITGRDLRSWDAW